VTFHLSDLLFWAKYYRTAQDIGLLTIAVGQWRPVWINQTCTVQRQYLSQTSRGFELKTGIHTCEFSSGPLWVWTEDRNTHLRIQLWPWFWIENRNTHLRIQFRTLLLLQRMTSSRLGKPEKEFLIQRKTNSRVTKNRSLYSRIIMWLSCD